MAGPVRFSARAAKLPPSPRHCDPSILENPINRRTHPGAGAWSLVVRVIPMTRPEVLTLPTGQAIYHPADWSSVTAAKPPRAGEWLIMAVNGLGPTRTKAAPWLDHPLRGGSMSSAPTALSEIGDLGNAAE